MRMRVSHSAEKVSTHSHAACCAKPPKESQELPVLVLSHAVVCLGAQGPAELIFPTSPKIVLDKGRIVLF